MSKNTNSTLHKTIIHPQRLLNSYIFPPSMFIPNSRFSDLAFFAPPPCLFQAPRLSKRWEYVYSFFFFIWFIYLSVIHFHIYVGFFYSFTYSFFLKIKMRLLWQQLIAALLIKHIVFWSHSFTRAMPAGGHCWKKKRESSVLLHAWTKA